jgi:ABC-2 type transport system permease protein
MQQTGDDAAAELSGNLMEKLERRSVVGKRISQFVPTLHLQVQLNDIARSGLENQLHFLDGTSRFHEKLRLYFYPKIFEGAKVSSENWGDFKMERFMDRSPMDKSGLYLPLVCFSLIFFFWGWYNLKNKMYGL